MESDLFLKTIKIICKLASINFFKAVVETGYMEDFYSDSQYGNLETAIDMVSNKLQQEVFEQSSKLEKSEWMKKSHSPELAWLFSFVTIREQIHQLAGV